MLFLGIYLPHSTAFYHLSLRDMCVYMYKDFLYNKDFFPNIFQGWWNYLKIYNLKVQRTNYTHTSCC